MNFLFLLIILIILAPLYSISFVIAIAICGLISKAFNRLLNAAANLIHWFITGTKVE